MGFAIALCSKSCEFSLGKYVVFETPVSKKRERNFQVFILYLLSAQINLTNTEFSGNPWFILHLEVNPLTEWKFLLAPMNIVLNA